MSAREDSQRESYAIANSMQEFYQADVATLRHLRRTLQWHLDALAIISAFSDAIDECKTVKDVQQAARDLLAEHTEVSEGGAFFVLSAASKPPYLESHWGISDAQLSRLASFFLRGRTRESSDASALLKLDKNLCNSARRKVTVAPISIGRHHLGAIYLIRHPADTFDRLSFLKAFGQQLGLAILHGKSLSQIQSDQAQLELLSTQIVRAQESERRNIAQDLHDEMGQSLTAVKLILEAATPRTLHAVQGQLQIGIAIVNDLLARVHDLSLDLWPPMLDEYGLLAALLWQTNRWADQFELEIELTHEGLASRFGREVEITAYRMIQEALTNAARHAQAKKVVIHAAAYENELRLSVKDNGAGFDPSVGFKSSYGNGLRGIRERVRLLGGQLTVESSLNEGTCLETRIPLNPSAGRMGGDYDD